MQLIDSRPDGPALMADRVLRPAVTDAAAALVKGRPLRSAESLLPDARIWNELLGDPALSAQELASLSAMARPRFVPQGSSVFTRLEPARTLVFVREGDAALGSCGADGQFRIERAVRGPGWLDQTSAWLDAPHGMDARATSPLVVVELPREDIQALLVTQPSLARRLIASLAREVHALTANTRGLMHKDAPARFAQWLVERCMPVADNPRRGIVKLTERKRDIASQLAITPETLSRLMRSLMRQGLISVAGYTVQVVDLDGLRGVAQSE